MPQLIIADVGGGWQALIANTNQALEFAGGIGGQEEYVQMLAQGMSEGQAGVEAVLLDCFEGVPEGLEAGELAAGIFGSTDALVFGELTIFEAAEGATLWEVIADAGAALLAAL